MAGRWIGYKEYVMRVNMFDVALLMEHKPDKMGEAMKLILNELKDPEADVDQDPVTYFFHETISAVLQMMGKGKIKEIDALLGEMRKSLNAESEDVHILDTLTPNQELTINLQILGRILAIYLSTSNLAKLLAILSDPKYKKHRNIIRWLYRENKRASAQDIPLYPKSTTSRLLNTLTNMGFLEKEQEGRRMIFDLTWAGRNVGSMYDDIYSVEVTND